MQGIYKAISELQSVHKELDNTFINSIPCDVGKVCSECSMCTACDAILDSMFYIRQAIHILKGE